MRFRIFLILICFTEFLFAKEFKLGPLQLEFSEEYYIENNETDLLIGSEKKSQITPRLHFNIQLAEMAKIESGEIQITRGVQTVASEIEVEEYTNDVCENGNKYEKVIGSDYIENEIVNIYAVEITGKEFIVYVALIDSRSRELAFEFFESLFKSICKQKI